MKPVDIIERNKRTNLSTFYSNEMIFFNFVHKICALATLRII